MDDVQDLVTGEDGLARCGWAGTTGDYAAYHDTEWGRTLHGDDAMFERLSLEGFQAGLAWITVLRKREAFRKAFRNFDPKKVAAFKEPDIARLLEDPGIIRSRAKIEATIRGAQIYQEMREKNFSTFAWDIAGGKPIQNKTGIIPAKTPLSEEISAQLKKRGFKFVGPVIVYAWMQASGMVNDHDPRCFRRNAK